MRKTQNKDTFEHWGQGEVFHWAGVGAAFVELSFQIHKWVETLWQDQILTDTHTKKQTQTQHNSDILAKREMNNK